MGIMDILFHFIPLSKGEKSMFKLIGIREYGMTRDVILKDLEKGCIEVCFDDSAVVNKKISSL